MPDDAYLDTIKRLEPDIAMIDHAAGIASIAISLKRLADAAERIAGWLDGNGATLFTENICEAVRVGIWNAQPRR